MKGKLFYIVIAISSIAAAIYGYHRFKLIRPDLFDDGKTPALSEAERAARIAEYQQKGDALTRAAMPKRKPAAGQSCVDGFLVEAARAEANAAATPVLENGKPVACDAEASPPSNR
jgi:hypothetical protein